MRRVAQVLQKAPWIIGIARLFWRIGQPKFTAGSVGVVLNAQNQVLLVEHVFHPYTPWGLPGGWVDRHENPSETIVRELREELQLTVEVDALLMVEVDFGNHLDFAFLCRATSPIGNLSNELLDYRWYDMDALPKLRRFNAQAINIALKQKSQKESIGSI